MGISSDGVDFNSNGSGNLNNLKNHQIDLLKKINYSRDLIDIYDINQSGDVTMDELTTCLNGGKSLENCEVWTVSNDLSPEELLQNGVKYTNRRDGSYRYVLNEYDSNGNIIRAETDKYDADGVLRNQNISDTLFNSNGNKIGHHNFWQHNSGNTTHTLTQHNDDGSFRHVTYDTEIVDGIEKVVEKIEIGPVWCKPTETRENHYENGVLVRYSITNYSDNSFDTLYFDADGRQLENWIAWRNS